MRINTASPTVLVSYLDYSGDGGTSFLVGIAPIDASISEQIRISVSSGHVVVGADGIIRSTLLDVNDSVYWSVMDPSQPDAASVTPVAQFPWILGMMSV